MTALDALKLAYRKHVLDDERIGWDELSRALCDAICNEIGDREFQWWVEKIKREL